MENPEPSAIPAAADDQKKARRLQQKAQASSSYRARVKDMVKEQQQLLQQEKKQVSEHLRTVEMQVRIAQESYPTGCGVVADAFPGAADVTGLHATFAWLETQATFQPQSGPPLNPSEVVRTEPNSHVPTTRNDSIVFIPGGGMEAYVRLPDDAPLRTCTSSDELESGHWTRGSKTLGESTLAAARAYVQSARRAMLEVATRELSEKRFKGMSYIITDGALILSNQENLWHIDVPEGALQLILYLTPSLTTSVYTGDTVPDDELWPHLGLSKRDLRTFTPLEDKRVLLGYLGARHTLLRRQQVDAAAQMVVEGPATPGTLAIVPGGVLHKGPARGDGGCPMVHMPSTSTENKRLVLFAVASPLMWLSSEVPVNGYEQIWPVESALMLAHFARNEQGRDHFISLAVQQALDWRHELRTYCAIKKVRDVMTHLKKPSAKIVEKLLDEFSAKLLQEPGGKELLKAWDVKPPPKPKATKRKRK